MQYVFIGLIVILLLAGAVALVLGRQGINRTTLVFAWLVLVTTAGFIFLAGRVGERERIWREKVRDLNAQIRTTTFGTYAGKVFFISDTADSEAAGLRQKILQLGGSLSNSKTIRSNVDIVVVNDPEKIPPKAKELSLEVLDKTAINNALTETLQGLEAAIIQKRREQARIETWRNRHWSSAFFTPPKVEPEPGNVGLYKAVSNGELRLILSAEDSEKPVNTGAELALFNLATD
ncbi:MAG: BRCT domain-containing protein, partial [Planctomycetaceae bacterium]|nr:BRCT domain-containing protein [Planctomycetaceae bacterium]